MSIGSIILKHHKTMNHKIHEENDQDRAEDLFCPPPPLGPWVSPKTSQEFKTSKNVNNSRDFNCNKCDYTASSRNTLKIHKKRKHLEMEMYPVSSVTMLPTPQSSMYNTTFYTTQVLPLLTSDGPLVDNL